MKKCAAVTSAPSMTCAAVRDVVARSVSDECFSADTSVFMDRYADGVFRNPLERREPRVFVDRGIVHPSILATMA